MTRSYKLTKAAEQDIVDIWEYIRKDNPIAARNMVNKIYASFDLLSDNPNIGHAREDLTNKALLFWTVRPRYHVIYRLRTQIQVIRVLPADRDLKTILN
jgi:plasmid stabilization system protein ParE